MQTVTFYGASDDLIEIDGINGADEFYSDGDEKTYQGVFNVGGQLRVFALYLPHGVWSFAVAQVDDGVPLPDWPIRIIQHPNEYSIALEIDVPDGVAVFREENNYE